MSTQSNDITNKEKQVLYYLQQKSNFIDHLTHRNMVRMFVTQQQQQKIHTNARQHPITTTITQQMLKINNKHLLHNRKERKEKEM